MEVTVYKRDGSEAGRKVQLDDSVFAIEPNDHAIWLDVRSVQAAARQGTHKTKERAEVAYSTRKLFRQKGTGGARRGSRKSPLLKGGGATFGPRPRKYVVRVNRKLKQLARRSALTYKARGEGIRVIENFSLEVPKTKEIVTLLKSFGLADTKVLLLTAGREEGVYKSGRNLPKLAVAEAANASTLQLLNAQVILLQEGALDVLHRLLGRPAAAEAGAAGEAA